MKITEELNQWLPKIQKALDKFNLREYEITEDKINLDEKFLRIASSDENFDSDENYEYSVQCSLDLKNKLDIYEMFNDKIQVTIINDMEYDNMIENLENATYEAWVSCENGLDYDDLTEFIENNQNGINQEKHFKELAEKGINVVFI